MKLNYRGVSYEYNPPVVKTSDGKVGGKYRGLDWRFRNIKQNVVLQPPVNLTYRGVAYANRPTATQAKELTNVREQARWLMLNKKKATNNRVASMLRRSAQEVGLV